MRATLIFLFIATAAFTAACGTASGRYDGKPITDDDAASKEGDDSPQVSNFVWTDADGKQIHLYDYLDKKVVMLDVAAFWCVNCKAEAPSLEKDIWKKFQNDDFELIQLVVQDANSNPATVQTAAQWRSAFGLTFEVCADPNWSLKPYFLQQELPFIMVLDKQLKIQLRTQEYDAQILGTIIKGLL